MLELQSGSIPVISVIRPLLESASEALLELSPDPSLILAVAAVSLSSISF